MSEHIEISTQDKVQIIKINRPEKKNALDLAMYQSMADAINHSNDDPSLRVNVIRGVEDCFCSGNDIKDFLKNPPTDDSSPVLQFVDAMINARKPVVAGVSGIAVGIGVTMLLHCDLVYASVGTRFQLPFVNIGLCPEAGSTHMLPLFMGHQKASELLLLGEMFSAEDAKDIGIVNKVIDDGNLYELVLAAAAKIATQPPQATQVTKQLLRESMLEQIRSASKRETEKFVPMLTGEEAKEALTAFMEKRAPDFSRF